MKKPLHKAPRRLQGMMLRLQKYDINVKYKPGRYMYIADTLSMAYINDDKANTYDDVRMLEKEDKSEDNSLLKYLPIAEERLKEIRDKTKSETSLQMLKNVIKTGWPA